MVNVARSTRAWIETVPLSHSGNNAVVARSTRAWIETLSNFIAAIVKLSHALRVRGLKQVVLTYFNL